ncbi:hypothetical protein VTP01DRAFT_8634 [Rhizomucor pusillus]|uniref:uncharacterized protein n=1 Tax=Rhizomucor pusillus TaxID=4840 RepID=UPI003742F1D2
MTSKLDKALDEAIRDRRSSSRYSGDSAPRSARDFSGGIRKRSGGPLPASRLGATFVRTVQLRGSNAGPRATDQQWKHDMFDDDRGIQSRLGPRPRIGGRGFSDRGFQGRRGNDTVELLIENLHYNVTENDLKDLFEMVGPVDKARIVYDASGRSTGVARIAFARYADTDAALEKYNNVELDGQPMRISKVEKERYNRSRRNDRSWGGDRGRRGGGRRDQTDRKQKSANELDEEMDAYMKNTGDTAAKDSKMAID